MSDGMNKRFGLAWMLATGIGATVALAAFPQPPSTPPATPAAPAQPPSAPPAKEPAVKIGELAPAFTLKDTAGKEHDIGAAVKDGKVVVIEWFNPECEWTAKQHGSRRMAETYKKFASQGVAWFAINSATTGKSADPARTRQAITDWAIAYPVLMDADGRVARLYGASVTPQIFIIDREGKIGYMGAVDDAKKLTDAATRNYLDDALTRLAEGETLSSPKTEPVGCQITGPGK